MPRDNGTSVNDVRMTHAILSQRLLSGGSSSIMGFSSFLFIVKTLS